MRFSRTLIAVLIAAPFAAAAELQTLDGRKITGDIVSVVGNDLTFKGPTGEEKFLVTTIHSVTTGPTPKVDTSKKHTTVELVDGSLFRCSEIVIKGKNIELKMLGASPRTLTVPMRPAVYAVNREAGDAKFEQDFRTLLRGRGRHDLLVFKRQVKNDMGKDIDELDSSAGTFGEGDAESIKFTLASGANQESSRMNKVSGMIFSPPPPDKEKPPRPAICKVIDSDGNEYVAAAVTRTTNGYSISTVSEVKVDFSNSQVSKFDFAAGAIKYLSDLEPVGLDESGTDPEHYQKDLNLDKRPIRIVTDPAAGKSEVFPKGLTLKAKTIITYELKGQYKAFRAIVGVDADPDNVAPSHVKITIDDGTQPLYKGTIKKGDKPVDLNLSVQNVDKLKITVESEGSVTDLGNQVSLANARVLK